ncbi:MAG: multiheme c-type cytochrome [Deltaproteobacteria bacterium]|nr:multiheme c-type cytochrome [Deltaproteobacteria bacterium]
MSFRSPVFLLAFGAGFLLASFHGDAPAEEGFRSATACTRCHPEIHRTWRSSRHATAYTAPLFQVSLDGARRENPQLSLPCEHCHNPLRFFLDTDDPKASIFALEGVTCDFCHSVEFLLQGIQGAGFPRYLVNPGIKFGPYPTSGKSDNGAHRKKFSMLHTQSVFCAGCHEYRNAHGIPILSTYSEWEESFYHGKNVHCQFCHFPGLFDAPFIDPGIKKGPIGHDMAGGHSRELLAKALPIRATLTSNETEACVTIQVKNEFAGHKAPSGIPINRLRLETTLYDGDRGVLGRGEDIFERVLGDGNGMPLRMPERFFPAAKEVLKDNRIEPKEVRKIVYRFPLQGKAPRTAEIALLYEIFLPDLAPALKSSTIPILRIAVPVTAEFPWPFVAFGVLAAAILVLAAVLVIRR